MKRRRSAIFFPGVRAIWTALDYRRSDLAILSNLPRTPAVRNGGLVLVGKFILAHPRLLGRSHLIVAIFDPQQHKPSSSVMWGSCSFLVDRREVSQGLRALREECCLRYLIPENPFATLWLTEAWLGQPGIL
jgi:hypothetical protein